MWFIALRCQVAEASAEGFGWVQDNYGCSVIVVGVVTTKKRLSSVPIEQRRFDLKGFACLPNSSVQSDVFLSGRTAYRNNLVQLLTTSKAPRCCSSSPEVLCFETASAFSL